MSMEAASTTVAATPAPISVLTDRSRGRRADPALQWTLAGLAAFILVLIAFFFVRLLIEALPAFQQTGVVSFVFTNDWVPSQNAFGALPLLVGTLVTSAIALLIGVPVAIATALYVTELAPTRVRQPLTILVELLAAVPSVVYGLWGIFFLAPKLQPAEKWFADTFSFLPFVGGTVSIPNYFVAGLILAIMILPIVSAISREVMATVPKETKEAALALGPSRDRGRLDARPGPRARRDDRRDDRHRQRGRHRPLRLLPGLQPRGSHRQRVRRGRRHARPPRRAHRGRPPALRLHPPRERHRPLLRHPRRAQPRHRRRPGDGRMSAVPAIPGLSGRRRATDRGMRGLALALTGVALVPLVLILYYLLKKGLGAFSVDFFTTDPTGRFLGNPGGIRSAILGTIEMVAIASAIAVPFGVGVAVWLVEYGRTGWFANLVRYFIDVMTGVPSVVFGLFVYIVLVVTKVGGTFAAWKGAVALALLMLPVVTRSAEVVLSLVPDTLREGALALGAPRWRVIFKVVLPTALPGIVTGSLLAVARAAGETAPLLFSVAFVYGASLDPTQRMNSLPLQIFNDVGQAQDRLVTRAWGAALTLVLMILVLTMLARVVQRRSRLAP
jgi:phosphate transport system permease protein